MPVFPHCCAFGRRAAAQVKRAVIPACNLLKNTREFGSSSRGPVVQATVSPALPVAEGVECPPYVTGGRYTVMEDIVTPLNPEELTRMRVACRVAADVLDLAGELVEPGVTAETIDNFIHEELIKRHAYPSPLGYMDFPRSSCISVNEVVCHGIPDSRPIQDGDLVKIDVSCYINGFHGDNCRTFEAGTVDPAGKRLNQVTKESLEASIEVCKPGALISDIGECISNIASEHSFGVVREYSGHGLGRQFHMLPFILHYPIDTNIRMQEGWIFTIEPMITEGSASTDKKDDGWTVVCSDGLRCAQYEHTILITSDGAEVLTDYEYNVEN